VTGNPQAIVYCWLACPTTPRYSTMYTVIPQAVLVLIINKVKHASHLQSFKNSWQLEVFQE